MNDVIFYFEKYDFPFLPKNYYVHNVFLAVNLGKRCFSLYSVTFSLGRRIYELRGNVILREKKKKKSNFFLRNFIKIGYNKLALSCRNIVPFYTQRLAES